MLLKFVHRTLEIPGDEGFFWVFICLLVCLGFFVYFFLFFFYQGWGGMICLLVDVKFKIFNFHCKQVKQVKFYVQGRHFRVLFAMLQEWLTVPNLKLFMWIT